MKSTEVNKILKELEKQQQINDENDKQIDFLRGCVKDLSKFETKRLSKYKADLIKEIDNTFKITYKLIDDRLKKKEGTWLKKQNKLLKNQVKKLIKGEK